jgi:putative transcription antitermination factor YqgF
MSSQSIVCLDVGEKRIGVAVADTSVRIAVAFDTIVVDGDELNKIAEIVIREGAKIIVVGYPRNQTWYVEHFAERLKDIAQEIVFQDESLTSVMAENRLIDMKKPYTKSDIDAQAAAIILEDYMGTY